ncbi:hypothetical protein ACQKEK_00780 [Pseudomonas sp. NPDC077408]
MQTTTTKQHVQRPMIFDQKVLDSRITAAQEIFKNSHAAHQKLQAPIFQLFIEELLKLSAQGYAYADKFPCRAGSLDYSCYLSKPASEQESDLLRVAEEVEAKYRQEIEDWNQAQKSLLADQLYQAEKKKIEDAERKKEEKLRAQAEKEAAEYFNTVITKEQESK